MKHTDKHGPARAEEDGLIPKHGGYRNLKTFQLAELIHDVTVRFCDEYIDRHSRTHDQMVQAARSGQQNILEGSVDSAVSKKMEMKLTGVANGSLEELQRDYKDFLRHRRLPEGPPEHPALMHFRQIRPKTLDDFRAWVADEAKRTEREKNTDKHGRTGIKSESPSDSVRVAPCSSVSTKDLPAVLAANGALSLLNLCIYLLDRQLKAQAKAFEEEGGFTERLYRRRMERRNPRSD